MLRCIYFNSAVKIKIESSFFPNLSPKAERKFSQKLAPMLDFKTIPTKPPELCTDLIISLLIQEVKRDACTQIMVSSNR